MEDWCQCCIEHLAVNPDYVCWFFRSEDTHAIITWSPLLSGQSLYVCFPLALLMCAISNVHAQVLAHVMSPAASSCCLWRVVSCQPMTAWCSLRHPLPTASTWTCGAPLSVLPLHQHQDRSLIWPPWVLRRLQFPRDGRSWTTSLMLGRVAPKSPISWIKLKIFGRAWAIDFYCLGHHVGLVLVATNNQSFEGRKSHKISHSLSPQSQSWHRLQTNEGLALSPEQIDSTTNETISRWTHFS